MTERPQEKALEKIIPKLKENTTDSEEFITNEASQRVNEKITKIIQNLDGLIKRKGSGLSLILNGSSLSLILNDLENMRDNLTFYMDAVDTATKTYKTYIYALEALYNEYKTSEQTRIKTSPNEPTQIVQKTHSNNNLISDEMYNKICSVLKEKGVVAISAATGDNIGISKATLFRFIKVALQRGDITKVGHGRYELLSTPTDDIEETSEEQISEQI